jgi:threonyl-tRNA synthetase
MDARRALVASVTVITVSLPDGTPLQLPDGATGHDAATAIGPGLAKAALAVKVDGDIRDLARPLPDRADIAIVTPKSGEDYLYVLRHTTAHVLAEAVQELFPGTKFGFGPPIEDGFYYDFELPRALSEEDFPAIEAAMRKVIKQRAGMARSVLGIDEARAFFATREQGYKVDQVEFLANRGESSVSLYQQNEFVDLCQGPHLHDTGRIGAFKLLSVAGAYWRGESTNPMLTRLYATAFPTQAELDAYLARIELAKARDHRRLGRELELFYFDDAGPGFPFYLPNGMVIVNEIQAAVRAELDRLGYQEIRTPMILSEELWKSSGHWDHYHENMYFTEVDEQGFAIKPMNCPGACLVFRSRRRSYRELPLRLAEFGHVHRHELSGVLHGLFRARAFTQDDAHIFCRLDQVHEEVRTVLEFIDRFYARFGFDLVKTKLSTRPEKAAGTDEMWERAEAALAQALDGRQYELNPGDGAFYGPKIDFLVTDSMGRSWQLGTCQLDFSMPEAFDLNYTSETDAEERPVIIHRAILGSIERFLGILIEDTGGDFPFWLAPEQARVVPVADRHRDYAEEVRAVLRADGLRVQVDARAESIGRRIRDGELHKVPYLLIVGDREVESGTASVRARHGDEIGDVRVGELGAALLARDVLGAAG